MWSACLGPRCSLAVLSSSLCRVATPSSCLPGPLKFGRTPHRLSCRKWRPSSPCSFKSSLIIPSRVDCQEVLKLLPPQLSWLTGRQFWTFWVYADCVQFPQICSLLSHILNACLAPLLHTPTQKWMFSQFSELFQRKPPHCLWGMLNLWKVFFKNNFLPIVFVFSFW